ncbi:MAG: protein arginine kinase [Clostridiales bacterium]|jgi:protein arginine kinase|nr:protein arginine kinase [Clostridiales bacterium]
MNNARKWYDEIDDSGIYMSSRVRLARNLRKYPFTLMQTDQTAQSVITEAENALMRGGEDFWNNFIKINIDEKKDIEKYSYVNKHAISPEFFKRRGPKGLFLTLDEQLSVMVNEEDHLRLQAIFPGNNMEKAWERISRLDDLIEESIDYAFDKDFGFLTSCPTNTGTGLRASYMAHLPMLEFVGEIGSVAQAVGKLGMTIRGIYGEGTEPMGSIYQISNQVTIGKSEEDIILALNTVTAQIIEKERAIAQKAVTNIETADKVYRAYGILTHCRKISLKEAVALLSEVRFGYVSGALKEKRPKNNIYAIMMNIQNALMQHNCGRSLREAEADALRAEFIRNSFSI